MMWNNWYFCNLNIVLYTCIKTAISPSLTHFLSGFPLEESKTDRKKVDFVAGLVFRLECISNSQNVSWSRVPSQSLENISGITIKDDTLWFLPARPVHSGEYSCLSRY